MRNHLRSKFHYFQVLTPFKHTFCSIFGRTMWFGSDTGIPTFRPTFNFQDLGLSLGLNSPCFQKNLRQGLTLNRRICWTDRDDYGEKAVTNNYVYEHCQKVQFPEDTDPLLSRIVAASDTMSVLDIARDSSCVKVAAQAVSTIWWHFKSSFPAVETPQSDDFIRALHVDPGFHDLLRIIDIQFAALSDCALVTVTLALRRLRLPLTHPLVLKLLHESAVRCPGFDLTSLAVFSVSLERSGNNAIFPASQACARFSELLDDGELKQAVACVCNLSRCLSWTLMNRFENKVTTFLNHEPIADVQLLLKLLHAFVIRPEVFTDVQQKLLTCINSFVSELSVKDLVSLKDLVNKCDCNTDAINSAIMNQARILLKSCSDEWDVLNLCCCLPSHEINSHTLCSFIQKETFRAIVTRLLTLAHSFPETHFLDKFFNTAIATEMKHAQLQALCKAYLLFCISKNYRNVYFEKEMSKQCLELISSSLLSPRHVASATAVVIVSRGELADIFDLIYRFLPQFMPSDLSTLSCAVNLAFKNSSSIKSNGNLVQLRHRLNAVIASQSYRVLSIPRISDLIRTGDNLYQPREFGKSLMFEDLTNRYNRFLGQFSPKLIRDTANLLSLHSCFLPHMIDSMAKFVTDSGCDMPLRTISALLRLCFNAGYCPEPAEPFLQGCRDVVLRQHGVMDGLSFLQTALTLGLFQYLNSMLIHLIFNVSFMDKLDKEMSVSTSSYAKQVRSSLVSLNRVACIDIPEENVPWFHNHYCQNKALESNHRLSIFEKDVYDVLCEVLPGPEYVRVKVYSPYYYQLSFECLINGSQQPLPCADYGSMTIGADGDADKRHAKKSHVLPNNIRRVAINAIPEESYCANVPRLKGFQVLKNRHLEMLGYKIVQVPVFEWNSLQLSNKKARIDYLYKRIFNNQEQSQ